MADAALSAVAEAIAEATGDRVTLAGEAIGGGCISRAFRLRGGQADYFVKLNTAAQVGMFAAEAEGLNEIVASASLRAPAAIAWGSAGGQAWLVLEYLPLGGRGSASALGRGLAAMHRTRREHFGWQRDNTIGATPQVNDKHPDWVEFYRRHRLAYQFELAGRNGGGRGLLAAGERLMDGLEALFTDYRPLPSLLHGDLWSGNYGYAAGEPVVFDPAVYFGDREADLAMTELFGGFGGDFYAAYHEAWPLDPGYATRKTLYNLYHVLNHFNLFGGGYLSRARRMTDQLVAELGQ